MTQPGARPVAGRWRQPDPSELPVQRCWFPAMGTQVELLAVDPPGDALTRGRARLAELEQRWSRFLPGSETAALNHARGRPVAVSPETLTLVALAVVGWQVTGGRFDPTVLDTLERGGYDRSFDLLTADAALPQAGWPIPAPGLAGVVLDHQAGTVTLPTGRRFDPGGIAKGYAADLLCAQLLADGAAGVCVNIGGDLRVRGVSPHGSPWIVAVPYPRGGTAATLELPDGAVATSSPLRRAWGPADRPLHHLIDPRTGQPANTGILQVTVVADEAWWAEVLTKAAYLTGLPDALELVAGVGAHALAVDQHGRLQVTAGLEPALWRR